MGEGLRTVYLGQYEHDHAERLCAAFEAADIAWTFKQTGRLAQFLFAGEWGVRLFVDATRIDEARAIAGSLDQEHEPPASNA